MGRKSQGGRALTFADYMGDVPIAKKKHTPRHPLHGAGPMTATIAAKHNEIAEMFGVSVADAKVVAALDVQEGGR
jgi:hypothetical protein